jgi:hypothetical protein
MDSSVVKTVMGQFTSIICQKIVHWKTAEMDDSLMKIQRAVHWQTPVNGQFTGKKCQWRVHWQTL